MKILELKEKTELRDYVKKLTNTITDRDIDICHDENNEKSPAEKSKLKTTLILFHDKTLYTKYERENFPTVRKEINDILKQLKKDNEIKIGNIQTVLADEQNTIIFNWTTTNEKKQLTQIKGDFHGYIIFNLFIYGTSGIYKVSDIKNAVKNSKQIYKIINDADTNSTVPYFFIGE